MKVINQFPESGEEAGLAKKLKKAWIFITLTCLASSLISGLITLAIPGCHCDEGAGCNGCGLNFIFEFLIFGGFIGFIFSLILWPFVAIIIGLIAIFKSRS